jgi:mono/diheme cytochrome c family protein
VNRISSLSVILISLCACTKEETTETGGGTGDSTVEQGPTWSEMSDMEKNSYMATDVVPQMAAIFQAYDAEYYAEFDCATCHGANAGDKYYAMPSDIYDLEVPAPGPEAGPTAEFMHTQVVPKMAELLDMEVNDGSTGGFGCYNCHSVDE